MSSVLKEMVSRGVVSEEQLHKVRQERSFQKRSLQEMLIAAGSCREEDLFQVAVDVFAGPVVDLDRTAADPQLAAVVPLERAIFHGLVPVRREGDVLVVAMSDPSDVAALDEINFLSDLRVEPALCRHKQVEECINTLYRGGLSVHDILEAAVDGVTDSAADSGPSRDEVVDLAPLDAEDSSFVQLINKILCDAVEARASDIHIEPRGKTVEVRYRIDGCLQNILQIPRDLQARLTVRIKLLARLDIAEQRRMQDGRIKVRLGDRKIDLRISVVPVFYGEKIVLRILDTENSRFDLGTLGFQGDDFDIFHDAIHKSQGVVLVTGPTGSGKTTTLYSALQHIKCETMNIVTIEDPIEYLIEGINQLQLSRHKDVTFATSLRSILRQDPDAILVGEIRDRETAEIAFRSALTGHLVFSTLHTNSAVASITRLMDIGIEPYLIASSISLLVAQRLIRLVCPHCCEREEPDGKLLDKFRGFWDRVPVTDFYRGQGCEHCGFTGYYGRTSIFEMLRMEGRIREMAYNRAPENQIRQEAVAGGMRTLAMSGLLKVAAGATSLEEVARVVDIVGEDWPASAVGPSGFESGSRLPLVGLEAGSGARY
ncbi:MAG: type II/IV secretion system protein [Candidatus Omnitrophica bacterium]|nr:type II/IV secretion system protein [Candidatus Omnitrophota bacterium]